MKLVQDLPEIFEEFGEKRREAFLEVKEYKDRGVPVVGMYCAYFPTELAMAVGAIPVGLCSFSNETVTAAERELPKSMCPLVKSSYGFAIEDKCPFFHFADLVIGETTCDGKKKMYELMAEFKPVFVMELPNSQSEKGLEFWRREVIRTKEYFEEFFHVIITDKMIHDAVHLSNEIRRSLKELCEVMKLDPAPVFGADIQKMINGSKYRFDFKTTPELVDAVTERILEEYHQGKHLESRPRILVTGCPIGGDTMKILEGIEENGGVVVAVENCSGVKTLDQMVDETQEDIYGAIAKRYLSTGCSIMTPNDNRIELIGRIIEEYHVDGVVEMILSGCHATGAESIYIRKFVNEEKNLPYISIDTDYSSADKGQISTRLAAFIEMIQADKSGKKELDMNYCYKVVVSGISGGKSFEEILENVWEYTGVPVRILGRNQEALYEVGKEQVTVDAPRMIHECSDGSRIEAVVLDDQRKMQVQELTDILAKSFIMYQKNKKNVRGQKHRPDYLWVLATDVSLAARLATQLSENDGFSPDVEKQKDNSILITNIHGKEERDVLIQLCKEYIYDCDGKILIGNGVKDEHSLIENKRLQQEVFKLARDRAPGKHVYLIEEYYHELAISYISQRVGENGFKLKELELIRQEDSETGRNLYETLYWYLRMKRNVSQTAAKLKIHRNTLLPRLTRLNDMLDLDNRDGAECEKLLIAMEIERMKKSDKQ